jgi:hypothetical protein
MKDETTNFNRYWTEKLKDDGVTRNSSGRRDQNRPKYRRFDEVSESGEIFQLLLFYTHIYDVAKTTETFM